MTSGLSALRLIAGLAAVAAGVAGCGSNAKTGSDKFVGTWTYAGMINPNCAGSAQTPLDLTGYSTTITASDASHITVQLGTVCTVMFDVDGFTATAQAKQTCVFDLGATLGMQTVMITKWTLTSTGMDTVTSDFAGTVSICTAAGTGTLTRVADAGTTD
ncbi:MAG TPA: hypothetical protein VIF57_31260 [Polyangia bacterium]|jgi:hypothetical protein